MRRRGPGLGPRGLVSCPGAGAPGREGARLAGTSESGHLPSRVASPGARRRPGRGVGPAAGLNEGTPGTPRALLPGRPEGCPRGEPAPAFAAPGFSGHVTDSLPSERVGSGVGPTMCPDPLSHLLMRVGLCYWRQPSRGWGKITLRETPGKPLCLPVDT